MNESPEGLKAAGRALWVSVADVFELQEHEQRLLLEAARTADQLDALADAVAESGVMVGDRVHPAVVESRQLRLALARLLASVRIPDDDDVRGQRRGAVRRPYRGGGGRSAA